MPHLTITAEQFPDKPAIIMGGSGKVVTYRELDEVSNRAAHLFRSLGLQAGDHIAVMMANSHQFMEVCWAAQRSGLIYTTVSTHLTPDETAYIVDNCDAKLFICSDSLREVAAGVRASSALPKVENFYMVGDTAEGYASWEEAIAEFPTTPIADESSGSLMLYSSGTTGRPKGISITEYDTDIHASLPLADNLGAAFGFTADTVYISPAPLYHAAPLRYNMLVLFLGATTVIMEKFDAEDALALIEKYRATHSQWVPIMFIRMLKLPLEVREKYDVSSMKCAIHAAAPCPIEIKQQMIDWWGPVINEFYASSEGMGFTIVGSADWQTHPGTVGRALDAPVYILDDQGNELPTGEIGNVYFGPGETTFQFEYYKDPVKTAETFNDKGWSTAGDIGYLDDEGYLYLTDRKSFMIISGGVNIYPQEIENTLVLHDKVADVAVFGIPNAEFGEEVKAVVQPKHWEDASEELEAELISWARQRLSGVKLPKSIDFMETLPRFDNGKLYKKPLAEKYRNAVSV